MVELGRKDEDTRADCFVHFEPKISGGIDIEVKSRVGSLYGDSIRQSVIKILEFFKVENCYLYLEDYSAFPWVIMARVEAAVKRAFLEKRGEFLLEFIEENLYKKDRDNFRRTRLYVPGDQPRLIINAGLYRPDGIILDLEDSVAPEAKFAARFMVRNALRVVDFMGAERMVRINQIPEGLEDLPFVVPHNLHTVLIPKCEIDDQVRDVDKRIEEIKEEKGIKNEIFLIPIIESALGIVNAYRIAKASDKIVALAIGLEDFTQDIGAERTKEGKESLVARQEVIIAARAAGVQPLDTVFSDVADEEGLKKSVEEAKMLGFEGKGCIHPLQIRIIHQGFAPTKEEIEKAERIVKAMEEAEEKKLGVIALGTKMIDPPIVKRAKRVLKLKDLKI